MTQVMHIIEAQNHQHDALAHLFMRQQDALSIIKLLCQLTKAVQQHRGASMAFLSGEESFLSLCQRLQNNVERVISILRLQTDRAESTMTSSALDNIANDWKTILVGWQSDQVLHNFEFHGHLINGLKQLIRSIMKEHLYNDSNLSNANHRAFLDLLFIQLPDNIESLATLRGLSTNVAIVKACGSDSHVRLSFLLREIPQQNEHMMQSINRLCEAHQTIPSIETIKEQQKNVLKFLLSIQMNILDSDDINTNSTHLFTLSTTLIDIHWLVIDDGLQVIEKRPYERFIEPGH